MTAFLKDALFLILIAIVLLVAAPLSEKEADFTTHPIQAAEMMDGEFDAELPAAQVDLQPRS